VIGLTCRYGRDGNAFSNVSITGKGRVELLGISKIDFLAYASNDAWQVSNPILMHDTVDDD